MRSARLLRLVPLFALLFAGCAKFPTGVQGEGGKRLIFTITFATDMHVSLDNSYYYFVLINNNNDLSGTNGPLPVISNPWGNGYAAGRYTHIISCGRFNPGAPGQCFLWRMLDPDHDLNTPVLLGLTRVSTVGGRVMQFEINSADLGIDLTKIGPGVPIPLQVNVIATNEIPQNPNDPDTNKQWDAFGDATQQIYHAYITINIAQDVVHHASDYGAGFEPQGDVQGGDSGNHDEALDIVDFTIDVRS